LLAKVSASTTVPFSSSTSMRVLSATLAAVSAWRTLARMRLLSAIRTDKALSEQS
jgi:hypothetical protein